LAALVAVGRAEVSRLLEGDLAGARTAGILRRWRDDPARVSEALSLGVLACAIASTALATSWIAELFPEIGAARSVPLAAAGAGLAFYVVAVWIPRSVGAARAGAVLGLLWLVHPTWRLTDALWRIADAATRGLTRALGGDPSRVRGSVTEEDIEELIKQVGREGSLDEEKEALLTSVIDFGETLAKEIMVPRSQISALEASATLDEVLDEIDAEAFSRYPVYEETIDRVIGLIYAKDVLSELRNPSPASFTLRDKLREPFFVPETKPIDALMRELQQNKMHMAIVVDEFGGTSGIVTQEDIIEEIFGEIYDEYDDVDEPEVQRTDDGRILVDGQIAIRDLEEELDIELPETSDYDTLAGFMFAECRKVPKHGDKLSWNGWSFTVIEADETRLVRVEVARETPAPFLATPDLDPAAAKASSS
jgi:putative hemolysin